MSGLQHDPNRIRAWASGIRGEPLHLSNEPEETNRRVELALQVALENGQEDGGHRKMWVIDQIVRILAGDRYEQVITEYCDGEDGPETYAWDEGIAP